MHAFLFFCRNRCVHVTDIGLGYAATMSRLSSLSIRWCPQIRDFGIQTLCSMKSLKSIALSGQLIRHAAL